MKVGIPSFWTHIIKMVPCHIVLGGIMVISPQTILKEKKIDMISRQRGCDKAISLNSQFMQQSNQCCRKERSSAKNLPWLSKTE